MWIYANWQRFEKIKVWAIRLLVLAFILATLAPTWYYCWKDPKANVGKRGDYYPMGGKAAWKGQP